MSQENVEIVRQMVDAVNRSDPDAFVGLCAPDVEWEENTTVYPGLRRRYRGLTELREWLYDAFVEVWEDFRVEIEELVDAPDDRVLAGGRLVGRGKASGVETQLRGWWVLWFARGKAVRRQVFLDRPEALEAAGLSE
jgi:ketosteroid isomerase-like protein